MLLTPPATPPHHHGGPDALGVPQHDFSTNANACGPCPAALHAVQQADATRYPDGRYTQLREQLAGFHQVAPWRIVPAASASEFIFRITAWAARQGTRQVHVPQHGYGDYAQAARAWGMAVVAQAADAQLLWRCDPGNPLGTGEEAAWADALLPRQTGVLDRAYEPLRLAGQLAATHAQLDQLWQLWTPNKALGLTGVRAAYAIAPLNAGEAAQHLSGPTGSAVDGVQQLSPSWPLGAHGVALLQAWVQPQVQSWLQGSHQVLRQWKARQQALLASLGWACLPSDANFFCARPYGHAPVAPQRLADGLQRLRTGGIKLRDASSFGLHGHVRVSVQAPAVQDALAAAWQALAPRPVQPTMQGVPSPTPGQARSGASA